MVDVDDVIVKECMKAKCEGLAGPSPLAFMHNFTITSSISTVWFPRPLPYMVKHGFQGQPWAVPKLSYCCFLFSNSIFLLKK
jgi:hypothetical protein